MAGSLAGVSAMSSLKAHAADVTGYKALVMIFFKGGQDGADFAIPYDQPSWERPALSPRGPVSRL